MADKKRPAPSEKKSISIKGDVRNSNVFIGDNNTIIQKIFNIFKSDAETLEHRNRRILLGHVENAWIKGVLDASLHGAALLDLGIKQDPEAVTQYPWTLKKESTTETLPEGLSMLEIFDSIGMGRSLLILGAPGSGKTTMLLELARGLIARAREDVTQPIPMVFNLASWTEEKQILSENIIFFNKKRSSKSSELAPFGNWLVNELNGMYSVPKDIALKLIKDNELFLLLDGLDEVRQDSRAKCVDAINEFRKQNGLTLLAVCSRSQDYADLNTKLSLEGAIEVQPLTQGQITEFFTRFGDELAGIMQAFERDSNLRDMAETPLFLSVMLATNKDKWEDIILLSQNQKEQRKNLFNAYIDQMFERPRSKYDYRKKHKLMYSLTWLANRMIEHNASPFFTENIESSWLQGKGQNWTFKLGSGVISGLLFGLAFWLMLGPSLGAILGLFIGLFGTGSFGKSDVSKKTIAFVACVVICVSFVGVVFNLPVIMVCKLILWICSGLIFGWVTLSLIPTGFSQAFNEMNDVSWAKLELISKIVSDKNNNARQMNESEVILKKTIITNQNSTVVLQPSKQSFHFPSPAIAAQLATILGLWLLAIGFVWCNQQDTLFS